MKTLYYFKSILIILFLLSSFNLFSQAYLDFIGGTGSQEYCGSSVPSGTFALKLVGGNCNQYSYTWHNITGNGCSSNEPITQYISYPTQTTTYSCSTDGTKITYYFTITVTYDNIYDVSGGDCCANYGNIYLSDSNGSETYYYLYKDGILYKTWYGDGNSHTWTNEPLGYYTIKSFKDNCYTYMRGHASVDHSCCKNTTEISENSIDKTIKVYPNPAKEKVIIEIPTEGNYLLFNSQGQVIKEILSNKENSIFEFNNLTPGVYFIRSNNLENNESIKFTVIE